MGNKLVFGVGINDADYAVQPRVGGKQVACPFYVAWKSMLTRCYSEKEHIIHPTYKDCTVCGEWLVFSNFKRWMELQDWPGKQLDKDILMPGNKVYHPSLCVFVDGSINKFTTDRGRDRGDYPIGVTFHKKYGKFSAKCSNPFLKNGEYLGCFTFPQQAHQAWKHRKHELACQLADLQTDQRVAEALRIRYL